VGYLQKDSEVIHRRTDGNIFGQVVCHAPQEADRGEREQYSSMNIRRFDFED